MLNTRHRWTFLGVGVLKASSTIVCVFLYYFLRYLRSLLYEGKCVQSSYFFFLYTMHQNYELRWYINLQLILYCNQKFGLIIWLLNPIFMSMTVSLPMTIILNIPDITLPKLVNQRHMLLISIITILLMACSSIKFPSFMSWFMTLCSNVYRIKFLWSIFDS